MNSEQNNSLEDKLRAVVETVDIANSLIEPLTKSIENLLTISSSQLNSEEASVLIREGSGGDLRFIAAIGKVADRLINMKVPAGKGIAGFVFSSGQPMVISDVGSEDTFYAEVDKQTGYSTEMMLATPLRHNGEVIGVLEYVNRIGEPPYESFTSEEMDTAAVFAEAVAALVSAYESSKLFHDFTEEVLSTENTISFSEVREWVGNLRETAEHKETLELAVLIRELSSRGAEERNLCRQILNSILDYSDSKVDVSYLSY